ncbi:MAG: hypothetical protein KOO66_04850 [Bacteroidales bacterium]|nr:hypothetical protein [Bacteroidales bacterium]
MQKSILQKASYQKIFFLISIFINIILAVIIFATINEKQIYTYFNSDTLYLPSIYKDLFIDKSGFAGWHLNGAPNFLPDMILFFIIRSFFNHFIPACFAFSLVQLIIILFLLSGFYKTIFKSINYTHLSIGALLMSLFLLVTLVNNDFVYTFYLLSISYHLGAFIMLLISFILLFKYLKSGKNIHLVILFIISILSVINDRLFIVMFSFPVFALIFVFFIQIADKKRYFKVLISNSASILIGLFLFRMLKLSGYIHIIDLFWKVFNFNNITPALKIFIEQHSYYINELDFRGIIDILFLLSFAVHIYLLIKNIVLVIKKKEFNESEFIYLLIFVPVLFLILVTPIINGNYVSWALLRYNIYSLYLGIFSYVYLLYKLQKTKRSSINYLSLVLVVLMLAESVFIITKISKQNIRKGLSGFMNYYPEKAQCIDQLSLENVLKYGVADYWDAKYITMFSKQDVRVYTVLDNLSVWYHVMNGNWFYKEGKGKYGNPEFNFVITNRFDTDKINAHPGIPVDTLKCINGTEIFIYPEFEFNRKTHKPTIKE